MLFHVILKDSSATCIDRTCTDTYMDKTRGVLSWEQSNQNYLVLQ